jgi:signal transduction histidine kinase/ligand-binding sensor domain-containing protein
MPDRLITMGAMRWNIGIRSRFTRTRVVLGRPSALVRKFVLAIACAQILVNSGYGEDPLPLNQLQHKSWTVADGAPRHLLEVVQGFDGILWLSASDGLFRFDGLKFYPYDLPVGSTPTRNNDYSLYESKSGTLWAGSWYEGLVRVDGGNVKAYGTNDGLPAGAESSLTEDSAHTIWCVVGRHLLHLVGNRWIDETRAFGLPVDEARLDLFDQAGTQWIATTTSKLYSRPADKNRFQLTTESWPANEEGVQLLESPAGDLWIALDNYGKQESVVRQLNVGSSRNFAGFEFTFPYNIWDARFDSHGSLWVTGSGIRRITFTYRHGSKGLVATEPHEETLPPSSFPSGETHALFEDNEGDMWVTTANSLDRFRTPSLIAFGSPATGVATGPDVAKSRNGGVWIHTGNDQLLQIEGDKTIARGPSPDSCFNLFEDRTGAVWFNTLGQLFRLDENRLSQVPLPKSLSAVRIRQILQREDGSMLVSFKDLGLWKLDQKRWSQVSLPNLAPEQLSVAFLDSSDELWLGSISGKIAKSTPTGTKVYPLTDQLGLGIIYAFLETKEGLLVSGNDGIAALDSDHFVRLKLEPDPAITGISGMIASSDGDLWLNTGQGVVHILRSELAAALASPQNHVMQAELFSEVTIRGPGRLLFDLPTAVQDGTGRLWFNTSDVIAYIDPAHINRNRTAPILKVASVTADGAALDAHLRVPAGSRTLRVEYFGSNLTAPEKVRYKYKLDGVDDDWQDVGHRTEAVYTHLRPGSYSFHVMTSNGEGVWSAPVDLKLAVLPAFFETAWFLTLCCLIALIIAVLVFRIRLGSITRRLRDRAEERANERIRIARDLHDTLLQGFQGLMLSFHVAAQTVPSESPARRMLDGALLKADRLVVEGRDRISRLRSESLEGISLPDALRALGEELNARHALEFEIQIWGNEVDIQPHVKDELFCIAREAITNSFRHANATKIGATLDYHRRALSMICHDNGCGIDENDGVSALESCHYGMLGMKERARRLSASFHCKTSPGSGTTISVRLEAGRAYVEAGWISAWIRPLNRTGPTES